MAIESSKIALYNPQLNDFYIKIKMNVDTWILFYRRWLHHTQFADDMFLGLAIACMVVFCSTSLQNKKGYN